MLQRSGFFSRQAGPDFVGTFDGAKRREKTSRLLKLTQGAQNFAPVARKKLKKIGNFGKVILDVLGFSKIFTPDE